MPKVGVPDSITLRITGTAYSPVAAGSPGPLLKKTPSGRIARMSSAEVVAGTTVTLQPLPLGPAPTRQDLPSPCPPCCPAGGGPGERPSLPTSTPPPAPAPACC